MEYNGSWLLVIKVPRAEYSVRPIYLTLNPFGGHAYRRRHEGDYKDTKGDTNKLSYRQEIIYKMLSSDDTNTTLSSTAIAKELGVSPITIKRELAKMAEIGVIKHIGPSYGGHWEVIDKKSFSSN